jgi:hypothetical protein
MTDVLLIMTVLGLLLCSLAMTALLRQVGSISHRLVDLGKGGREPGLPLGSEIPVHEFSLADGSGGLQIRTDEGQPTVLLFASLSCQLCRTVLEGMHELAPELLEATVLMLLDSGPWKRFAGELEELGLDGVRTVFAVDLVNTFEAAAPPYVYVVGAGGKILERGRVFSVEEFREMTVKHVGASEEISTRIFKEIVNE